MNDHTEELYEQTKSVLRRMCEDADIADEQGRWFILACHDCGQPFPTRAEVGMMGQHAELAHGWSEDGDDELTVDLIWIGEGPPPEPPL